MMISERRIRAKSNNYPMLTINNLINCSTIQNICQLTADIFDILHKGRAPFYMQNDNLPMKRDYYRVICDNYSVCCRSRESKNGLSIEKIRNLCSF